MYQQQEPLPGSYYGPPVPPQTAYDASGMRSINWIRVLLWTIIGVGFAVCLVALIVWLVLRPTKVVAAVQFAALSNFNLTAAAGSTGTLAYNMTADITFRNPNKRLGVKYELLEAASSYRGSRFDLTPLPAFFQGRKTTTLLHMAAASSGKSVYLGSSSLRGYKSDVSGGNTFDVDLWINGRVRYKFGSSELKKKDLQVICPLIITLTPPGAKAISFFPWTECKVEKW